MDESFVFDPRDLILPPYDDCPFCGARNQFGVLAFGGRRQVQRRCKSCMESKSEALPPPPEKKILYLDQFAISELMKILHPAHQERIRDRGDAEAAFWLELFEGLDRLVKLHLLVCPSSLAHWEESVPTRLYEDLRRMYEHLATGVSFRDPATIKRFQIVATFARWRGDSDAPVAEMDIADVSNGRLDVWLDRLRVTARLEAHEGALAELAAVRERTHDGLAKEVERWRTEARRSFGEYFDEQISAYGPSVLRDFAGWVENAAGVMEGRWPLNPDAMWPSASSELITSLLNYLDRAGVPKEEHIPLIEAFFKSSALRDVPFLKVSCGMLAAMAVKASRHQGRRPNAGMVTDINTISTLLPYCDAVFIDTECEELVTIAMAEVPLDYGTAVFSPRTRKKLLAWLKDLEAEADAEHLARIRRIYGDEWLRPYSSMFEHPADSTQADPG